MGLLQQRSKHCAAANSTRIALLSGQLKQSSGSSETVLPQIPSPFIVSWQWMLVVGGEEKGRGSFRAGRGGRGISGVEEGRSWQYWCASESFPLFFDLTNPNHHSCHLLDPLFIRDEGQHLRS